MIAMKLKKQGMARNKPDEDFDAMELAIGTFVEFEHIADVNAAKEIAKDHLLENRDYYKDNLFKDERKLALKQMGELEKARALSEEAKKEEQEEKAAGKKPSREDVISFLKKNPRPEDYELHAWAEKQGYNVHATEELFYELAAEHVKMMGKALDSQQKVAMKHPNKLGAGAKKRKKLRGQKKFDVVMAEFARGTLHDSAGKIVTDKDQALAIAYSESGLSKSKSKIRLVWKLNKGRALPEGTIRTWKGKKFKKVNGKWVPHSSGKDKSKNGPPAKKAGALTEENLKAIGGIPMKGGIRFPDSLIKKWLVESGKYSPSKEMDKELLKQIEGSEFHYDLKKNIFKSYIPDGFLFEDAINIVKAKVDQLDSSGGSSPSQTKVSSSSSTTTAGTSNKRPEEKAPPGKVKTRTGFWKDEADVNLFNKINTQFKEAPIEDIKQSMENFYGSLNQYSDKDEKVVRIIGNQMSLLRAMGFPNYAKYKINIIEGTYAGKSAAVYHPYERAIYIGDHYEHSFAHEYFHHLFFTKEFNKDRVTDLIDAFKTTDTYKKWEAEDQKSKRKYYTEPTEVFSRIGEAIFYQKLSEYTSTMWMSKYYEYSPQKVSKKDAEMIEDKFRKILGLPIVKLKSLQYSK